MKATREIVNEMVDGCVLMRSRLISRVISNIYDEEFRPYGINSPQFALLVAISSRGPVSRAEIGRFYHQDRSTLTRNLKIMIEEGWLEEVDRETGGRARPIALTRTGEELLQKVAPIWRDCQGKAKNLLGQTGVDAIKDIAGEILAGKSDS